MHEGTMVPPLLPIDQGIVTVYYFTLITKLFNCHGIPNRTFVESWWCIPENGV